MPTKLAFPQPASGGGIYNSAAALSVTNSTFSGNSASFYGAGIALYYANAPATVTNSTFSGNVATGCFEPNEGRGGGIGALGLGYFVTNSTFSGNRAAVAGGGIYGEANLKSTILANNTISGGASPDNCDATITDVGYNISDDNSCGFTAGSSRNNTDPQLDPAGLSDHGGPTQTIALQSSSPAIDTIPPEDCIDQASPPNRITTDQRGALRPDAAEVSCDIGAYEVQDFAGKANCQGHSVSALARQYGGLKAAAAAYGFPSVKALQAAIRTSCGG